MSGGGGWHVPEPQAKGVADIRRGFATPFVPQSVPPDCENRKGGERGYFVGKGEP
jgi:hypothetical protein